MIRLIDLNVIPNEKQLNQRQPLIKNEITIDEIYAFIGILILFGITKKIHVRIDELWSEKSIHFTPFAVAAMSRERFQLIALNITFDDLGTS